MALFAKKKPPGPAADEQKISLALTPDEIDLLRECMKRTEAPRTITAAFCC